MWPRAGLNIQIKTPDQIRVMREAGLVVARTLRTVVAAVEPGVTTAELDALAEREIRAAGATASFKGYHGYPATICTSVNDEIVHGIPSPSRRLRDGDIISIDCGAIVRGWHGDAAVTVGVGTISAEHAALLDACQAALWRGLARARAGGRLGDISHAVEASIRAAGSYGLVEEYTGHGIGTAMHMDPPVPNYGRAGRGPRLRAGMALAVEPMVMLGGPETVLLDDGWTVVTADGSWAAHFEHTVAITADGPWVLTADDGPPAGGSAPRVSSEDQGGSAPCVSPEDQGGSDPPVSSEDQGGSDPRVPPPAEDSAPRVPPDGGHSAPREPPERGHT